MIRSAPIKAGAAALALFAAHAAAAREEAAVELTKCQASYGTIAIADGDQQGWTQFNLATPRPMLGAMIEQSGCFALHNPASGKPADFLLTAVAGSKEEIDKTMNMAKGALTEGLVRSGAAGQVLGHVPMGGALFSAFGGLGGKKKTISAGLKIMSPATGQTLISGTGEAQKSIIKVMDGAEWVAASQGAMGQYATSTDGKVLTTAFLQAYNNLIAQGGVLAATRPAAAAEPAAPASVTVAVDTKMWSGPAATGTPVRALRAATALVPTGQRQGLFVEVSDNYGSKGWVSVEDLR